MTTRYCGIGGADGNSGLTWVLRKATLNGLEDTPVVAGDVCYVGPGCYRELLTVDVSGAGGNLITYIGDVTGEHTDGVGGIVRITGSDNDQAAARANCIDATAKDYRIFRGFSLDTTSAHLIDTTGSCTDWTIEDCMFQLLTAAASIRVSGDTQADFTIRRCLFLYSRGKGIEFTSGAAVDNSGHLVQNCIFLASRLDAIQITAIGDIIVRNCLFIGFSDDAVDVSIAPNAGHPCLVNNCIFCGGNTALEATAVADMTENYNTFSGNSANRLNVNVGANSQTYPPLFLSPILHAGVSQISGFKFPWWLGELSEWSQIRAITGSNEPTEDLHGVARPVTASKNSWGAIQFRDMERETGTTRGASTASLCLHDAGRHQIWVPVANESTTISVYVYREANYAGNNPQMIVKQPGQADDMTTDAAAASQWNLLTTTFTPAADPPYVVVELVSRNTNGANDKVFFDDLVVN